MISCLALILGAYGDSGRSPSWDDYGKKATIPNRFRESHRRLSRIGIRADNRRFAERSVSSTLLRRGTFKAKGVNFFTTGFLSELDSGLFL